MFYKLRGRLPCAAASAAAVFAAIAVSGNAAAEAAPPYRDLLAQAQGAAPRLAEAKASLRQAEGLARQAGARPNPTVGIEVENFNGSGPFSGTASAETTVSLAQPIELGGKRTARLSAGRASVDAARARLAQARADFAFDLANAYAQADAADKRVSLAEDAIGFAQEDLRAARVLVTVGQEAELRQIQAEAALAAARSDLGVAQASRVEAYGKLTAMAGSPAPFTSVAEDILARPPIAASAEAIDPLGTPAVAAARAEREAAAQRVRVERTRATPDLTASVGLRRFSGDDSTAMVAGLSLPIPMFDRNRGAISAAQAERNAAEARLNAARLDAEAELRTALYQVAAARTRETAAAQGEATAAEAYRLTRVAYESGKASLIELITARRALADARNLTIDTQLARLRAEAGLARLQGRPPFGA